MVKLKTTTIGYFEAISARNRMSIAYFGFKPSLYQNIKKLHPLERGTLNTYLDKNALFNP
jgi:hypothetical protein